MRYQKPHDYSGKEAIFINVENDDSSDTYVLGDLVLWKLADDSGSFTAGNLPAFNTQGYRVEHAADAAGVRAAGFVSSLPADNAMGANVLDVRPASRPFELQVYGFMGIGLPLANGIIALGASVECGAVAGSIRTTSVDEEFTGVGFCMDAFTDTNRDGAIFIRGLL